MKRRRMRKLDKVTIGAVAGLVAAALVTELRKPAGGRTWHGKVAGLVPYDFRPPTTERVRARLWNPDGALIVPHVFGVGWSVNPRRLLRDIAGKSRSRHA